LGIRPTYLSRFELPCQEVAFRMALWGPLGH